MNEPVWIGSIYFPSPVRWTPSILYNECVSVEQIHFGWLGHGRMDGQQAIPLIACYYCCSKHRREENNNNLWCEQNEYKSTTTTMSFDEVGWCVSHACVRCLNVPWMDLCVCVCVNVFWNSIKLLHKHPVGCGIWRRRDAHRSYLV